MTHQLSDDQWRRFFLICADVLLPANYRSPWKTSLCAFTCFDRLEDDLHYWHNGLPRRDDIFGGYIGDGGVWGQPCLYRAIAHIIIPKTFILENTEIDDPSMRFAKMHQDIETVSDMLNAEDIAHRRSELVLEIKCY